MALTVNKMSSLKSLPVTDEQGARIIRNGHEVKDNHHQIIRQAEC